MREGSKITLILKPGFFKQNVNVCVNVVVSLFAKSETFRDNFTGYTESEKGQLALSMVTAENFRAIENKLNSLVKGWLLMEGKTNKDLMFVEPGVREIRDKNLKNEYSVLLKALEDADEKATEFYGKYSANTIRKRRELQVKSREIMSAQRAAERAISKFKFNSSLVVKILRSLNIEATKTSTSAIKGFHFYSDGYRYSDNHIELYGMATGKFDTIVSMLLQNGFVISTTEKPYQNSFTGRRAGIIIEPFHSDEKLGG